MFSQKISQRTGQERVKRLEARGLSCMTGVTLIIKLKLVLVTNLIFGQSDITKPYILCQIVGILWGKTNF